jgi:protein gp37
MADKSAIEWTDATWNPVTGCTEVSPGCDHCYAKTFAERFRGVPGHPYEQGFELKLWPKRLDLPARWKKPRRIFVNSMSDLFHKDVPDEFIFEVFRVMISNRHHTYQVLTKRPRRMARLLSEARWWGKNATDPHHYTHIWLGTTIENDAYTWRANYLRQTPAAVRFVSAEPLLSALPSLDLRDIHWLIAGGESGHGARPAHPDWVGGLRDQAQAAGVAFFFKQWGAWKPICEMSEEEHEALYTPAREGDPMERRRCKVATHAIRYDGGEGYQSFNGHVGMLCFQVGKDRAGRLLDGRTWDEYPMLEAVR